MLVPRPAIMEKQKRWANTAAWWIFRTQDPDTVARGQKAPPTNQHQGHVPPPPPPPSGPPKVLGPGRVSNRGGPRDALEGGGGTPPPSGAPSLWPATVSLAASASLNGICNQVTAPNRFGNLLQPPI